MVELKNEYLIAKFNEVGAELKSLVMEGKEYIWAGHPDIWKSSCPLMFPVCGGMKEDRYTYQGKEYLMTRHGFARTSLFAVESVTDTQVVFCHTSCEETRAVYPFDYQLRVRYTLEEKSVRVEYHVKNLTDGDMYFSIGSHEGYFTPEGIEDYDVLFPEKETLSSYVLCGTILSENQMPIIREQNYLPLYEKYFMIDTLVFKDLKSRSATLRNRKTGRTIRVDFPDARYFMIWHKPGAPYICLEPWDGVADTLGSSYAIEEKEGIRILSAGQEYRNTHTITIVDPGC